MKILEGFIAGLLVGSAVWGYFHVQIKGELDALKYAAVNVEQKVISKIKRVPKV